MYELFASRSDWRNIYFGHFEARGKVQITFLNYLVFSNSNPGVPLNHSSLEILIKQSYVADIFEFSDLKLYTMYLSEHTQYSYTSISTRILQCNTMTVIALFRLSWGVYLDMVTKRKLAEWFQLYVGSKFGDNLQMLSSKATIVLMFVLSVARFERQW